MQTFSESERPVWLYQVKQGATTIWESWEGNTGSTGVASLNHYSKGAVVSWLVEGICGIRVSDGKITIRPQPHPLMQHAEAVFDSPLGRIESGWGASPYKRGRCVGAKRRRKHYVLY